MSRADPQNAADLVATATKADGPGGLAIIKDWLRSAIVDNLALKAVAFLLALTLFILVHSDEDEIVPVTVKLAYAAPRDGLTLASDPPSSIRVSIKGSRRRLRRLVESELDPVQVTLTNTGEYVFQSDMIRPLPEGLSVASISPASISLVYENTKDKRVPLRVRTVGDPALGFRVGSIGVEPGELDIRGAESALARLDELVTQPVSIAGATGKLEATIALAVPPFPAQIVLDEQPQTPQDLEVQVTIDVVPSQGVLRIAGAKLSLRAAEGLAGNVEGAWKVEPAVIDVVLRGESRALEGIDIDGIGAVVAVYPADGIARVSRTARIELEGVPTGVAIELSPATVALSPK